MANTPTEDLNPAGPLDGIEQVHIVQGGNSRRTTTQAIADLAIEWSPHTFGEAPSTGTSAYNGGVWLGNLVTIDEDGRLDSVVYGLAAAETGINFIPAIYANNAGSAGALLASGPQVNNGAIGDNILHLAAPLSVTAGQQLWIGAYQANTGGISAAKTAGTPSRYFTDTAPVNDPGGALTVWADSIRVFAKGSTKTAGVEEAPIDDAAYVRRNGLWVEAAGGEVEEAPSNGNAYVRKDGAWVEDTFGGATGGGDVEEAPTDGKAYVRKDGAWVEDTFGGAGGGGGGGSTIIIGGGDGSAWRTEAVGTGASQNITIPMTDLDPAEVMVFVNGILYDTDEYTIAGTTLTITTNAAADEIAIYPVGASSGGGGGGSGNVVPTATGPSGHITTTTVAKYWRVRATAQATAYLGHSNVEFRSVAGVAEIHAGTGSAIASSAYVANPTGYAYDGSNTTSWVSNGDGASWVGFNFDTPRSVAQLAIRDRPDDLTQTMSAFVVERSDDGITWTAEWAVAGVTWSGSVVEQKLFANSATPLTSIDKYPTKLGALNDVDLTGLSDGDVLVWDEAAGKFLPGAVGSTGPTYADAIGWRIKMTAANAGKQFVSVGQLRFLDADGNNLVGGGAVVSSGSFNGSFGAANAFDGTTAGDPWICTDGAPVNSYIGYTFPTPVAPVKVAAAPGATFTSSFPTEFVIQYTTDNVNWTDLNTVLTGTPVAQAYQYFDIDPISAGSSSGGGGGAPWAIVASQTISAPVGNVDLTGLGGYDELLVIARGVTMSVSDFRLFQVSTDNGATFFAASGNYVDVDSAGVETNRSELCGIGVADSAGRTVTLHIPQNIDGAVKVVKNNYQTRMFVASTDAIDAIRVKANAGNLTGGTIQVLGRSAAGAAGSGGGTPDGGGWANLTFPGASAARWGGNYWESAEGFALQTGDVLELEVVTKRSSNGEVAMALSGDGLGALRLAYQGDNNRVLYRHNTSGGASTVLGSAVAGSSQAQALSSRMKVTVGDGTYAHGVEAFLPAPNSAIISDTATNANVPLNGLTAKLHIAPIAIENLLKARYRIRRADGTYSGASGGSGGGSIGNGEKIVQYPIDVRPSSPHAFNDEFDGTTLAGAWTWVNQTSGGASGTAVVKNSSLRLSQTVATAGQNNHGLTKTRPGALFDIIAKVRLSGGRRVQYHTAGLCLRDPTSGIFHVTKLQYRGDGAPHVGWITWNSPTSSGLENNFACTDNDQYLRIKDDGTNVHFMSSPDGIAWSDYHTEASSILSTFTQIMLATDCESGAEPQTSIFEWVRNYPGGYVEPSIY